jgi:glutamyl-tRNA synthetase
MNTRIAPSPTGDMHLGTARTAYFNWLAARATGGKFILRIDDTDTDRNDSSKIDDILRVMDWLSLDYDELVYQSNNIDHYNGVADMMVSHQMAKRLDDGSVILDLDNYLDLKTLLMYNPQWTDQIAGDVFLTEQDIDYIKDMPLIKRDGMPTYNFASVVDDDDLEISHVIRGNDHFKNTTKQVILIRLLSQLPVAGTGIPTYTHLGLLFKSKKKLSKRDGASSMISYMEAGYDPDAMLNFLLRLGWGPTKDDKSTAIITRNQALQLFLNGGKMKNTPANVDLQKLDSFDRKYKGRKKSGQL